MCSLLLFFVDLSVMYLLEDNSLWFPDPHRYHPEDGLLAVGGDLSVERLLLAYSLGIFPWFNEGEAILWWCPDPRFVLFPSELRVSKSMKKVFRERYFTFTENQCFEEVVLKCASVKRKGQEGTWISKAMIQAYLELHRLGVAQSFEVWQRGVLVGGFYGVILEGVFCGESMFSTVSNASKAGFINFVSQYQGVYKLIDCQVYTAHLESLGARSISKMEFLKYLKK